MATSRFLMSTDVVHLIPLMENDKTVVSQFPSISEHFSTKNLSTLLAEPAMGDYSEEQGYNTVRWHSPMEGSPIAFIKQREAARDSNRDRLAAIFSTLAEMIPSHPQKNLLLKALLIPERSDIHVISGNIVLINWGFVPAHAAKDETTLRNHFQTVYGEFCDINQIWPLASQPSDTAAVAPSVLPVNAAAETAPPSDTGEEDKPPSPPSPPEEPTAQTGRPLGFWVFMTLLLIFIGMLIGWFTSDYYQPRIWPKGVDAAETHRLLNESLRRERDELRAMLKEPICDREDVQTVLNPGENEVKNLPSDPGGTSDEEGQSQSQPIKISDLMEQSVVMVIVPMDEGTATGTGFLISPKHIITNKHVVEGCSGDKVGIVNKRIGKLVTATIQTMSKAPTMTRNNQYNGGVRDYAVLTLTDAIPLNPLRLAASVEKLAEVYVGGYPGFFTQFDPALKKLADGDLTQAPEMIQTKGEVSVVQKPEGRVPWVVHSAQMAPGNSGGPLIDSCGRVVAINTFISQDPESGAAGRFSLVSSDLMAFLDENNVKYQESQASCQ